MRRGTLHWYDIILFGLAAMIVYPDKVLEWLSDLTGRALGWKTLLLIESVAIALMVITMVLLMPVYPKLEYWHPMLYVGVLGLFRLLMWLVLGMFGFDD